MDKICVSIFANDFDFCLEVVKKYDFVELRLDEGKLSHSQVSEIITTGKNIIATCRKGYISDEKQFESLLSAINHGCDYIDIEHDLVTAYKNKLIDTSKANECKIISSYHNLKITPNFNELKRNALKLNGNCDIIKIACKVNTRDDLMNLIKLYDELPSGRLISIGLGELGKISRIAALFLGAPFTYASYSGKAKTADGQIDYLDMKRILDVLEYDI
ncbi:MAG: type I 3-dehydroquinate dehydratase [Bacteroidetes bacterium]|nr:MAG: type I 3-dehydroquinate dehydratase [Bacteroidota bacterium]